ncbi:MAG: molybdenum cofactor biosynthesis protein MoaE [Gammaproteobacteria bacterium]|nr:molybdenum cofactor biosynthesis protein MoaE [Gammaproteobacteria bacterium]
MPTTFQLFDPDQQPVLISAAPFDPEAALRAFRQGRPDAGAVVSFLGQMRDYNEGDTITAMALEHYPAMTTKSLQAIIAQAKARWPVSAVAVIHRVGLLYPEDPIVMVLVAGAHRGDSFRACEFVIDYLKTAAPFWKREQLQNGCWRWVEGRDSDANATARWLNPAP